METELKSLAAQVLESCLAGSPPDALPRELVDDPGGSALFGVLAEGLGDRFEPALCDAYARLFAAAVAPGDAARLVERYQRVRRPRLIAGEPRRVFVLSRVTLGADVAITSVLLDAAKRRFPESEIVFAGPRKNYELFAGDPRIGFLGANYRRGSLAERLKVCDELRAVLDLADSVVLDPDSRLTQLGLVPVCDEGRYHFFESRGYGGDSARTLPELAAAWARETMDIEGARPYLALAEAPVQHGRIAISLGVGENPAKRIADPFEEELLQLLGSRGPLWIDKGAGGEEAARVERAAGKAGVAAKFWDGSFAGFASIIAGSALYVGYDSAGQHVAAASGVPLISIFAGFPAPRMFERWRPSGPGCRVIRVDRADPKEVLEQVRELLLG
ncbi:MAG TPA: glycosyltransferase family 9 protein [Verrucomicrobiae bacterium]|nr:glycosyltransferase family 9 protein [Verrucomicrobiae bacterium]